ncbi:uncharacterized protein LOC129794105 [Lutzomyia longipalpis]|uniref:uncharacterized protein LOC129794105 n=1 Tax=Lutzomyia longipalpis TaxID=7200 RepID=UPI0024844974|nr:uncharacterized protein LOC129794105 [Lutzomyia longipalpis]
MERIFLFAIFVLLIIFISCTSAQNVSSVLVSRSVRDVTSDVGSYPEGRHANIIHVFPPRRRKRRRRRCLRRRPRPYYDRLDVNSNKMLYMDSPWIDGQYQKHFTVIPLIESAKMIGDGTKFIPIAIIKHDPWGNQARNSYRGSSFPNHYVNLKHGTAKGAKVNPQFSYNVKFEDFPRFQQNSWDNVKITQEQSAILKKVRKYAEPGWGDNFIAQEPVPGQILYQPISPQYLPIPLLDGPKQNPDVQQGGFRGATNEDRWSRLRPSGVDRVKDFYEHDIPRTPSSNASRGEFYEDQIHKNHRHYLARNSSMARHSESIKPVYEDVDEGRNTYRSSYRATPFLAIETATVTKRPTVFVTPRSVNSTKDKSVKIMKMSGHMGTNYSKAHPIYETADKRMGEMKLRQIPIPTKMMPSRWGPVNVNTTIAPAVQQSDRYSIVDVKPNISLVAIPSKRTFTNPAWKVAKPRMAPKDGNRKL